MRKAEEPPADRPGEDADPESVARKILLDQLSIKARSRKELEDRLAKKDVPEEVATRLLDRFEEVGLVDDEAFARAWVESRQRSRGLARSAIAVELRRKGIADETAKEVLAEVDPGDEEAAARQLVRRKLRSMKGLDEQVAARRLVGMLARKGYSAGLAYAVVRQELALQEDEY
ncbi:regulatory protein [Nocardioides sp. J9]|uniref:regulatory protein RecX n=1 Tax=unclassified Nocardioides TaxID=2615069 RepID=UPI00048EF53E|nr:MULTISPECIES: regulatory protein RecX [unclassified Nocardioides]TWG95842.1 regulatory protein [Nocardioides sp. J9]